MKIETRALARTLLPLFLAAPTLAGPGGEGEPDELDLTPLQEAAPVPESGFLGALKGGDWWLKLNLRYQYVDADPFSEDANALTLRAALGYRTGKWHDLSGVIEVQAVQAFVDDYNSLVNGKTQYPVVPDPQTGNIFQGYVDWNNREDGVVRVGRQAIDLDNQRFVGKVGWRQNYQSFDAGAVDQTFAQNGRVFLAWIDNVNTILGDSSPLGNQPMGSALTNLSWNFEDWGKLAGYFYYLDYNAMNSPLSSSTFGVRFSGKRDVTESTNVSYTLEYASQESAGDNPNDLDGDYLHAKLGGDFGPVDGWLGYEQLGGSNNAGGQLQTPLATLHAFNGWADRFLITPQEGLQDLYLGVGGNVEKWRLMAIYHDFQSDIGSDDFGSEIDLQVTRPINEILAFGTAYANYMEADYAFGLDTQRFWLWLSASI